VFVLIQNGLNIERPYLRHFHKALCFPGSVLSDRTRRTVVSFSTTDTIDWSLGPFSSPNLDSAVRITAARRFVEISGAGQKCTVEFDTDVMLSRWRNLVYNACLNRICAITGLDTDRLRLAGDTVDTLVRSAMEEIKLTAAVAGFILPDNIAQVMIDIDPIDMFFFSFCAKHARGYTT
jgi:ketopantoate reductase